MKNFRSLLVIALTGMIYFISVMLYKPSVQMYITDGGDAFGYNVYLPSFFIYHDLQDMRKTMAAKYAHCCQGRKVEDHYFNKYFMGAAILQAPFFLGAHLLSGYLHEPQDGFTMLYMYAAQLSCGVYVLLALFIIMLILRRRFSDGITAITILILGLATNVYYQVVYQAPFCHPYLFFWYALLIFFTIRFYASLQRRYILVIGVICGMIMLTRLNELYVVLIPIFWGVFTKKDLTDRIILFKKFSGTVMSSAVLILLCLLPQSLYWKASSDHFIYYSYQDEHFDFLHPRIWDGFFSGSNGWLIYTPIMIFALVGIWFAYRKRDPSFMSIAIYLPVHIYVIYSWWCWFYMGSYGSRPMAETYPLLSIPLAYSIEWLSGSIVKKVVLGGITIFCIWLVMMQTYQTHLNIFNSELSNWRYNVITLGKTQLTYEESIVLNTKEFQPKHPVFVRSITTNDFEDPSTYGSDTTVASSGRRSVCVKLNKTGATYSNTLEGIIGKPGQWIKASVNCLVKESTDHNWHLSSMVIACTRKGKLTKWRCVGLQNKINNPTHEIWHWPVNQWGRVYFYSQIPSDMLPTDTVEVYIDHGSGPDIYVDDLKIELYDNK